MAAILAVSGVLANPAAAAPTTSRSAVPVTTAQNVDYISPSVGAALDLGFPVLVPGWVPAPFAGEPSVEAGGGSYSLYWMNGGGEPTFLQVQGVVGGGLPAGSPYDLNIELSINASVNGYDAIHDVTPIYDAVWWIQGGVLYSVQSRNMTGTDSLSLAQSLIAFVPPAAPEPTSPPPPPPTQAPAPNEDVGDTVSDQGGDGSSTVSTEASDDVAANTSDDSPAGQAGQTDDPGQAMTDQDEPESTTEQQSGPVGSDGTGMPSVASDGTGGPPVEVVGTDGTGGRDVIVIPRRTPVLVPIP
jgi:hypothetical protein